MMDYACGICLDTYGRADARDEHEKYDHYNSEILAAAFRWANVSRRLRRAVDEKMAERERRSSTPNKQGG